METVVNHSYYNVGRIDAVIRLVLALVAIAVVLSVDLAPVWAFALSVFSIPTVLFAVMRWDPLYRLFGIRTTKDRLVA